MRSHNKNILCLFLLLSLLPAMPGRCSDEEGDAALPLENGEVLLGMTRTDGRSGHPFPGVSYEENSGKKPTAENIIASLTVLPPLYPTPEELHENFEKRGKKRLEWLEAIDLVPPTDEGIAALENFLTFGDADADGFIEGQAVFALVRTKNHNLFSSSPFVTSYFSMGTLWRLSFFHRLLSFGKEIGWQRLALPPEFFVNNFLFRDPEPNLKHPRPSAVTSLIYMKENGIVLGGSPKEPTITAEDVLQEIANRLELARRELAKAGLELPPPNLPPEGSVKQEHKQEPPKIIRFLDQSNLPEGFSFENVRLR